MGLLDGLISGGLSILGGSNSNKANAEIHQQDNAFNAEQADLNRTFSAEQADKQMQFQERMSNTSYQRAVGDMQAAGLNPMLAYSQGGSSTPVGAAGTGSAASASARPDMKDIITPALSSAMRAAEVDSALDMNKLQQDNTIKQGALIDAQTRETNTKAALNLAEADTKPSQQQMNLASASQAQRNADKLAEEIPVLRQQMAKLERETHTEEGRRALIDAQTALTRIETKYKTEQINYTRLDSMLKDIQIQLHNDLLPASDNEKEKAQTVWGKYMSPYLNDFHLFRNTTK